MSTPARSGPGVLTALVIEGADKQIMQVAWGELGQDFGAASEAAGLALLVRLAALTP